MLSKVKSFYSLTPNDKLLFIRAYYLLGAMRFAILTRPFKNLVAGLERHREGIEQAPLDAEELAAAHQVGWALHKVAQFTPWKSTCLVKVLAAQRMLQDLGIAGTFFLGATTRSEEDKKLTLSAHAWLICGNEFITGRQGHERFTVMSTFSWSKKH